MEMAWEFLLRRSKI